jgi:superfamily II DNA/RNA helicase
MLTGGFGVKKQKKTILKEQFDILVSTPGRLLLHMSNSTFCFCVFLSHLLEKTLS